MPEYRIRSITETERPWVARFTAEHWGSDLMVVHGEQFLISQLLGFIAEMETDGKIEPVGLVSYHIVGEECEITSLDSLREGLGIGTALIEAARSAARLAGCKRLFLSTTNDNTDALRFYQRRGFSLVALRRNAVNEARKIKPEISLVGKHGIPIRDEIELEMNVEET